MKVIDKLIYMMRAAYKAGQIYDIFTLDTYRLDRIEGEIIRNTHSIEKGLSLGKVRMGFGYEKIKEAFSLIDDFKRCKGNCDSEAIFMFLSAVDAYLEYHKQCHYSDKHVEEIEALYRSRKIDISSPECQYGGFFIQNRSNYSEKDIEVIKSLFKNRHSVREFDGTEVDEEKLRTALEMACRCPSACNRQGYRVHVVPNNTLNELNKNLNGIGGFANDVNKFILITGKLSVYRKAEEMQYIVTASVFAAYLTLALEAVGIGCCFVQRNVLPNKNWESIAESFHIPADEQAVCMLAIGNLKENYKVPVSHRLSYETIVKYVNSEKI